MGHCRAYNQHPNDLTAQRGAATSHLQRDYHTEQVAKDGLHARSQFIAGKGHSTCKCARLDALQRFGRYSNVQDDLGEHSNTTEPTSCCLLARCVIWARWPDMTWCQSAVRLGLVGGLPEAKQLGGKPLITTACSGSAETCL